MTESTNPALGDAPILPSFRLDGQRALVTGAGRGIGQACAVGLAEAGAEVILVSRTAGEIEATAEAIRAKGLSARAVACDVTDAGAVRALFGSLDRLDILLNNAGGAVAGPLFTISEDAIDMMLTLNCKAAVIVAQEALKIMDRQSSGVVINLSSTFGKNGRPLNSVYSATKHFIEGFTKSIAVEFAPKGIRVCAVGPTAIDTPMTHERLTDPVIGKDLLSRIPMGRFGQPVDIIGAVVFLASPAAALITGTTVMIDGGWTAQ